ncbi:hypothetical protein U1Q18_038639 [Sarracenia purpurea var. burkii]
MFSIIHRDTKMMPSSAVNSRTPQCEIRPTLGFLISNSIGKSIMRCEAVKSRRWHYHLVRTPATANRREMRSKIK